MTGTPLDLAVLLGSSLIGRRKADAPELQKVEGTAFADQLRSLTGAAGKASSPATVRDSDSLNLTADQLERLGAAADKAEEAGLLHALVEIDGRTLVMDVSKRQVLDEVDTSTGVVRGVDGFVRAAPAAPEAGGSDLLRDLGSRGVA